MQFAYQFEWEQCNRDSNIYTSTAAATEQQLLLIAGPTAATRLLRTNAFDRTREAHLQAG